MAPVARANKLTNSRYRPVIRDAYTYRSVRVSHAEDQKTMFKGDLTGMACGTPHHVDLSIHSFSTSRYAWRGTRAFYPGILLVVKRLERSIDNKLVQMLLQKNTTNHLQLVAL